MMHAVRKHTDTPWVLLYIERWLKAPAQGEDGTPLARDRGTPQGGVISPLLANIFLHHVFDQWISRELPGCPLERYRPLVATTGRCVPVPRIGTLTLAITWLGLLPWPLPGPRSDRF
jgi:retron-type reverse transcriptase